MKLVPSSAGQLIVGTVDSAAAPELVLVDGAVVLVSTSAMSNVTNDDAAVVGTVTVTGWNTVMLIAAASVVSVAVTVTTSSMGMVETWNTSQPIVSWKGQGYVQRR